MPLNDYSCVSLPTYLGDAATACPHPVLDVPEVVQLEQAISAGGTSLRTLMQRAGLAVSQAVQALEPSPCKVVVAVGSGNNGGDGWVAALDLAQRGYDVTLFSLMEAAALKAEPARTAALEVMDALEASRASGEGPLPLQVVVQPTPEFMAACLGGASVAVDALLGTGFSAGSLRSPLDAWVTAMNEARQGGSLKVVAADVPSGVSARTGTAATPSVQADATVTMIVAKPGLLAPEAADHVGDLVCNPLAVNVEAYLGA